MMNNHMLKLILSTPGLRIFANDVDAFIPELWANESLMILIENMVAGSLVHRDFEPEIAKFGDIINTRRPGDFQAKRKDLGDDVTIQDAVATNVQVPLNQHVHTSFLIRDGEESKSFKDLVEEFLRPAMISQARFIDMLVLGQYPAFLGNSVGGLGTLTSSNAKARILDVRRILNTNKAPTMGRNLVLNPNTETTLLNLDLFVAANQVGDDGTALREASLGRKLGFDMFMDQNMAIVSTGNTSAVGAINNAAGYPAGTTTLVVDGAGLSAANISVGDSIVIVGDDTPHQVKTLSGGPPYTGIVLDTPLNAAVADNAVITILTRGAVNLAAGYSAGYGKEITVDGFTVAPQVGQMVTFSGDLTTKYTIINVNGLTGITLDKPLVTALVNDDNVHLGPAGNYNLAFHRNAIALVVRPLAPPKPGTGALSSVVNYNDLSIRAVITYDGKGQGHLVTLDMLCGIAVLDKRLGAVLLG